MNAARLKQEVIEAIIIRGTLDGALQRARVYNKNSNELDRKKFRNSLANELMKILDKIHAKEHYTNEDHFQTIQNFAKHISDIHHDILDKGVLRVGVAQKMVNLYWKLSWILKPDIKTPKHCPFDSVVIKELDKSVHHIAWTKSDKITDYHKLVNAATLKAINANSIADWELEFYHLKVSTPQINKS